MNQVEDYKERGFVVGVSGTTMWASFLQCVAGLGCWGSQALRVGSGPGFFFHKIQVR